MIKHYLTVAIRNLLKYKMQNLISIGGLAVGLFCFCVCFYISRFIGSVDECFENHERIAEVYSIEEERRIPFSGVSGKYLTELRQRNWKGVEAFTILAKPFNREYHVIQEDGKTLPYQLNMMEADTLYNKFFTPTFLAGSWKQASQTRNAILLPKHTAIKMFRDIHQAIGQQIVLPRKQFSEGSVTYTVQGVIEDLPENTSMNFMRTIDMLTINDEDGYESLPSADMLLHLVYAFLEEGYTADDLKETFQTADYRFKYFGEEYPVLAKPLGKDHRRSEMAGIMALVTGMVGLLILLAASLNFFHFQTGSFLNRGREFSIRKILGNTTSGLFWMQFVQIAIVISAATLIAGCLIELASPFLQISILGFSIHMGKEELLQHLIQYMGCLLVLTALVAFGIAIYIRRATMQVSLHGLGKVNGKKRLRNILLGVQFFICWLFVSMTAGLYLQSEKTSSTILNTLSREEKEEIITVPLDYQFLKTKDRQIIVNNIRQHAGIKDILFTNCKLLTGRVDAMFDAPDGKKGYETRIMGVTSNFADFMNIGLEGQTTQKADEILISRNFVPQIQNASIGKSLYNYQRQGFTITGILDDITDYVYADEYGRTNYGIVYFLIDETTEGYYGYVKCYPGKVQEVKEWIELKLREVLPVSVEPNTGTLQKDIETQQSIENNLKDIILFFSFVCLVITLLGVYSAITLDTERRQKEVAIRKVNGAGLKEIIALFARLYVCLLGISAIFGFPTVYLILQQWKQMYSVFFDHGILYWGGILLGVTLITALTVIFRILKIARINPATIIKSE